jgi:Fe-S cluster assembly protein SufD
MSLAALIERSKVEREEWRYTDLAPWMAQELKPASHGKEKFPSEETPNIVFENGSLRRDLSKIGDQVLCEEKNSEISLTFAKGTSTQLTLRHFFSAPNSESNPRLRLIIPAQSVVNLTEIFGGQPEACALHLETKIDLAEGAKLFHGKIIQSADLHVAEIAADVATGAAYQAFALTLDGNLARNEWRVALKGQGATCSIDGLSLLRGKSQADNVTSILHVAPGGTSRQLFKSVLAQKSRGVFQGKIVVEKDAQKTDGYQLSRALLLSDQAEMNAKPALEIYADDVKCSHGSTIGALDDEALFYLRSRGIAEPDAKRLLVLGFVGEMLDQIEDMGFRARTERETERWLHA